MSKVFEYMKPYIGLLLLTVIFLAVDVACALLLPSYMADIVNDGVLTGHSHVIWRNGIIMLLLTILGVIVAVIAGFIIARIATGVANDLRLDVFKKVLRFSDAEMNYFNTSSLITRTTNDITQVQNTLMMAIRQFIYAPMLGVGAIILAMERSASMTWIIAIATIVMVGSCAILCIIAMPKFKMWQNLIDRLNSVTRENLSGILIVRAFSTQDFEKKRFGKANDDLADTQLFVNRAFATLSPIIYLVMNLTTVFIVWIGAGQVSAFRADVGDIFAFLQYGMLIIFAFLMLAIMFIMVPRALVSAARIKEVLEAESSIKFRADPIPFPEDFKGIVEFKDVNFRYPDTGDAEENVLEGISFTAKPGETTAIIGSTGSGKSTVFKLLLRFFDVTAGGIYVDGIDIRDVHKETLHSKIGYVPQKIFLFSGNIKSNLLYANRDATQSMIEEAVDVAQAKEFVEGREDGYEANVAQKGVNFSGGQKQRISIARALVKNAPIYLFDDSFSALDLKTDSMLRAALKEKMKDSTMLVVAQRISTIMDAHQIVVLEHGKIAGVGTHAELMETCEVYRQIAASQLSEDEL